MTVRLEGNVVYLAGRCRVEDAEPLLRHLSGPEQPIVDISKAEHLHTAVLQVLLASRPRIDGGDPHSFAGRWIVTGGNPSGTDYSL